MGTWEGTHMSTIASMIDFMILFHYFHPFPVSMGGVDFLIPTELGLKHVTYPSPPWTLSVVT